MRLLTNNWIRTILFVWMEDLLLTVGPPCSALSFPEMVTQTLPLPRRGEHPKSHTELLYRTKPQMSCSIAQIISEENQTCNDLVWNRDCSQGKLEGLWGRWQPGADLHPRRGSNNISSSGGGQERSTAWDVSRPHSSDMSEFNSLSPLLCYCWFCENNNFLTLWTCSAQTHQLKNRLRVHTKE